MRQLYASQKKKTLQNWYKAKKGRIEAELRQSSEVKRNPDFPNLQGKRELFQEIWSASNQRRGGGGGGALFNW